MKTWSIDEMLAENPCEEYQNRALLETFWAAQERLSVLDVLRLEIPAEDRVWVATRPGALEPAVQSRWQEVVVTRAINRALEIYDEPGFVAWAQGWLDGTDRSAEAARAAAAAAWAEGAAAYAADAAAYAAAGTAWAAADAAAGTAWAAAHAARAALGAEREQQVADLVTILEAK